MCILTDAPGLARHLADQEGVMPEFLRRVLKSTHTAIILFSAVLVALLFYAFPPLWELGADNGDGVTICLADDISPAYRAVIDDFNTEYKGKI